MKRALIALALILAGCVDSAAPSDLAFKDLSPVGDLSVPDDLAQLPQCANLAIPILYGCRGFGNCDACAGIIAPCLAPVFAHQVVCVPNCSYCRW